MKRVIDRLRTSWRALRHSPQIEREMRDEMAFHVEMEAQRLAQQGLDAEEARRLAHIHFGGVEKFKEAGRDARGFRWIDALALDSRLGLRMLMKYKGLTLVGGFAMAVAIGIGATVFEALTEWLTPALPFAHGDRVVSLRFSPPRDVVARNELLRDLTERRLPLTTIGDLGTFRTVQHNLVVDGTTPEPIKLAEMSASGFTVAETQPLLGRYVLPSDEAVGAPSVVVIGYHTWQSRFAADPAIVGREVKLGGIAHTIVGVMPEGFGFPYDHQFWLPRPPNTDWSRSYVFGRLTPGATIEQAQAELTAIAGSAPESTSASQPLRGSVVSYTWSHVDLTSPTMVFLVRLAQLLTATLAVIVAINLAILVYARTVTRLGEFAVRTALGASRLRILSQLFVESLVLSLLGAMAGLGIARIALSYIQVLARANGGVPFWIRFELSPSTAVAAFAMAAFAALIMGVVPGLRATGRSITRRLHEIHSLQGGRVGAMWTTLVVVQVAAAVCVLPIACHLAWQVLQLELSGPGFAAEKFAISSVALPIDGVRDNVRGTVEARVEMLARMRAEPGVDAVTFSSYIPGFARGGRIQFADDVHATAPAPWDVSTLEVAVDMLDVYRAQMLAGRRFTDADVGSSRAVVVNESFARWLSGSGTALGARFRYLEQAGEPTTNAVWHEVVGVVRDFPRFPAPAPDTPAVVYHAASIDSINPAVLTARFPGDVPASFTARVRQIAAEVDPALQVRRATSLSAHYGELRNFWRYISWFAGLMTLSVLLLSAAGMYALMSCTVAQRTREIGIRVALGAGSRRLLVGIFARVLRQVTIGVVAGSLASAALMLALDIDRTLAIALMSAVAAMMLFVALAAAWGPARRSLKIQAADALRTDA